MLTGSARALSQKAHVRHARRLPRMPAQKTDACLPLNSIVPRLAGMTAKAGVGRSTSALGLWPDPLRSVRPL